MENQRVCVHVRVCAFVRLCVDPPAESVYFTDHKKHPQLPPALVSMNQPWMGPWHACHPSTPQQSTQFPHCAAHSTLSQRRLSVVSHSWCSAETLQRVCFAELLLNLPEKSNLHKALLLFSVRDLVLSAKVFIFCLEFHVNGAVLSALICQECSDK